MIRSVCVLTVAGALLAACADGRRASESAFPNRSAVPHPEALFDVVSRSADLRRHNGGTGKPAGERVCPRAHNIEDLDGILPVSLELMDDGPVYSTVPRDFARVLNVRAFRLLMDHDMERAWQDVAALRAHAERNAWIPESGNWSSASSVINAMGPLLPAWHILRQSAAASKADRAAINGWLVRLARAADVHGGTDSIGTYRGANKMMLGLMTGDQQQFEAGIRTGYLAQLRGMRPDGSFPQETARGGKGLAASARNLALLVYSAEIAMSQGIDLYSVNVEGRTIHDAVRFLLDSQDRSEPPRASNTTPGKEAQVAQLEGHINPFQGNASKGWIKLYTQRFPESALSKRLLARNDPRAWIQSDVTGGHTSCYGSAVNP